MSDLASFASRLESDGHAIRQVRIPGWFNRVFLVRGRQISIDGSRVYAFEYPTVIAAARLRASVSEDGSMIDFRRRGRNGSVIIEWISHFYSSGRLIVVFVGSRQPTIRTLEQLLGPQFAGV